VIISPLERIWPLTWVNCNSFHPRVDCTKFDWNRPAGSGEWRKIFFQYKHV
jgi:hypothetical protein